LNRDHKASEDDELARILSSGGRVEAFRDQQGRHVGPARVWHKHENIPGLAMSRSFGDHCAAQVGVIAEPEVLEMNLSEQDKFIVIASDGVWEFLSNNDVVRIVEPFYIQNSAEKAAEAIIKEALKRWKQEENVVDDITCIVIYLSI
jgi:serine/threonine protein phosphatase PrpC